MTCAGSPRPATRRGAWLTLAVFLLPLLAACAGQEARVNLPPRAPATTHSSAVSRHLLTERQQVIAAYTGYTAAIAAAFASKSKAKVRQLLRPYLGASAIDNTISAFARAWAENEIAYGNVVLHILSVRIRGATAWVHDCDNTSGSGLQNAATGQIIPGSAGISDDNLLTRLERVDGHWNIQVQTTEDVPCKP